MYAVIWKVLAWEYGRSNASVERGSFLPWMQRPADSCLGSASRLYVAEIVRLKVESP